jgi:hypothetical protein
VSSVTVAIAGLAVDETGAEGGPATEVVVLSVDALWNG